MTNDLTTTAKEHDAETLAQTLASDAFNSVPSPGTGGSTDGASLNDLGGRKPHSEPFVGSPLPPQNPNDPIRQFGIIVPPALRTAQTSFRAGAEVSILSLAEVVYRMIEIEQQITAARMRNFE